MPCGEHFFGAHRTIDVWYTWQTLPTSEQVEFDRLVKAISGQADLTILGLTQARLVEKGPGLLHRFPGLRDVLFVAARKRIAIE